MPDQDIQRHLDYCGKPGNFMEHVDPRDIDYIWYRITKMRDERQQSANDPANYNYARQKRTYHSGPYPPPIQQSNYMPSTNPGIGMGRGRNTTMPAWSQQTTPVTFAPAQTSTPAN
jgi:hypothetical protein